MPCVLWGYSSDDRRWVLIDTYDRIGDGIRAQLGWAANCFIAFQRIYDGRNPNENEAEVAEVDM